MGTQKRQIQLQDARKLGRHEPEQIRAGRGREPGRARERPLRSHRAADDRLVLEHAHAQTLAAKQQRTHEAVVSGADDDHIRGGHFGDAL